MEHPGIEDPPKDPRNSRPAQPELPIRKQPDEPAELPDPHIEELPLNQPIKEPAIDDPQPPADPAKYVSL